MSHTMTPAPTNPTTMTDTATTTPTEAPTTFYTNNIETIYQDNKLADAQNSLKQIAKILQAIAKAPQDKKKRQHPTQGIIVKKFVYGTKGGLELMKAFGFEETTIDNKPYLHLPDGATILTESQCDTIAEDLLAISLTNPIANKAAAAALKAKEATMGDEKSEAVEKEKEKKEEQKSTEPLVSVPCSTGCGFFGTSATNNMCSKCFRESGALNKTTTAAAATPTTTTPTTKTDLQTKRLAQSLVGKNLLQSKCATKGCRNEKWKGHHQTDQLEYNKTMADQPSQPLLPTPVTNNSSSTNNNSTLSTTQLALSPTSPVMADDVSNDSLALLNTTNTNTTTNTTLLPDASPQTPLSPQVLSEPSNSQSLLPQKATPTQYCALCHIVKFDHPNRIKKQQQAAVAAATTTTPAPSQQDTDMTDNEQPQQQPQQPQQQLGEPAEKSWKTLEQKKQCANAKLLAFFNFKRVMRPVQFNKERCWKCSRKVGITGTQCRCDFIFCGRCRGDHGCTYDEQKRYTDLLARSTLNDITRGKLDGDDE